MLPSIFITIIVSVCELQAWPYGYSHSSIVKPYYQGTVSEYQDSNHDANPDDTINVSSQFDVKHEVGMTATESMSLASNGRAPVVDASTLNTGKEREWAMDGHGQTMEDRATNKDARANSRETETYSVIVAATDKNHGHSESERVWAVNGRGALVVDVTTLGDVRSKSRETAAYAVLVAATSGHHGERSTFETDRTYFAVTLRKSTDGMSRCGKHSAGTGNRCNGGGGTVNVADSRRPNGSTVAVTPVRSKTNRKDKMFFKFRRTSGCKDMKRVGVTRKMVSPKISHSKLKHSTKTSGDNKTTSRTFGKRNRSVIGN